MTSAATILRRRELLAAAGGRLTANQVADRLGTSRKGVTTLRLANQLLAVIDPDAGWVYPACQFQDNRIIPEVLEILAGSASGNGWIKLRVLVERLGCRHSLKERTKP